LNLWKRFKNYREENGITEPTAPLEEKPQSMIKFVEDQMTKYKPGKDNKKVTTEIEPLTEQYNELEKDLKKARISTDKFLSKLTESRKRYHAEMEAGKTAKALRLEENLQEAWELIKEEEIKMQTEVKKPLGVTADLDGPFP